MSMMNRTSLLVAASVFAVGGNAWAQGSDSDIIVTAQRRAENVQRVPATVTALGEEDLQTRQIDQLSDLQAEVPSLVVGDLYGTNLITLRGISTGITSGLDDPSVATHINGVYQPRSRSIDSALVDLERVEVLSGPQGTLYGRNATGGVVNYILRGPSAEFEGELTGRVGNYDRYGIQGSVSGPLSEQVGFRLTGLYDDQSEGFTEILNADAPRDTVEHNRSAGGRLAFDFRPSDWFTIDLEGIVLNTEGSTLFTAFAPSLSATNNALLAPQTFEPHKTYSDVNSRLDGEFRQASVRVTWDLTDSITLQSITAYQTFDQDMLVETDASGDNLIRNPIHQTMDANSFTQEFNLNLTSFNDRLTSVLGAFYLDDSAAVDATLQQFSPALFDFHFFTAQDTKSYAFFMDHTLAVTDGLRLIAGIRYNHDEKTSNQFVVRNAATLFTGTRDLSWNSWTPRFGLQVDLADNVMLYALYTEGFKAGGVGANTFGNVYQPEEIAGGEVGLKSQLWDNRIRLNIAGYSYDYSNLQVQQSISIGTFVINNAAAARIYGIEAQLHAQLSDRLSVDLSGMLQDARYTDFLNCNAAGFLGACSAADPRPFASQRTDVSGNWLNRAAPYSANLGLEYELDLATGGDVVIRAESFFSGAVHYDEFRSSELIQGAYSLQNLFVTYTPSNADFTLRGFVKNIGDTEYITSGFWQSATAQQSGTWGPPRTFGAELTYRF